MSDERPPRAFRGSLLLFFVWVMAWANGSLLLLFGLLSVAAGEIGPGLLIGLPIGMAAGLVIGLPLCAFYIWLLPTVVAADGLRAPDFWGRPTTFGWDAIDHVRPLNLGGLRYLLVKATDSRRTLWLPLFLRNRDGFVEAVEDAAGDDHLVAQAYRQHRPSED